ncbi:hypothetical protein D5R93_01655 [Actinomyces lilanjuaniae]|uniref:Uncharacterized protein n=1 Tax=Actinomyces lilanjuaniae TaxID=2321394 RepID=A0ABN5PMA1_9ACTO|nr:hypothetical protein [Actinomyces lilanjuaniae]AYD89079.1 hypothetical protein D5R93_01655 [Actinomyces lilanjuaniae]
MTGIPFFFPDNTVLINMAVLGRVDLLECFTEGGVVGARPVSTSSVAVRGFLSSVGRTGRFVVTVDSRFILTRPTMLI